MKRAYSYYVYENNRVRIKGKVLRLHSTGFADVIFQVCIKVSFFLLI